MTLTERMKQIDFIKADTKAKGEKIVSGITFFAGIYSLKINVGGKNKTIKYSDAETPTKGYRPIKAA